MLKQWAAQSESERNSQTSLGAASKSAALRRDRARSQTERHRPAWLRSRSARQFPVTKEMASTRFETVVNWATLLAAVAVCASVAVLWTDRPSHRPSREPLPIERVDGVSTSINGSARMHGRPSVAVVEFSDFECPYCGKHARSVLDKINRDYVDTAQVAYVFRQLPLDAVHPHAVDAAKASSCAGEQGRFWEMHDRLFVDQSFASPNVFEGYASHIRGLDTESFRACLRSSSFNDIAEDQKEAARLGVRSTPSFFIGRIEADGKRVSAMKKINGVVSYEEFSRAIDDVIAESRR